MRQSVKVLIPVIAALALAAALSACGSSSSTANTNAALTHPAGSQASGASSAALVKTASSAKLGTVVLVNAQGMTLYHLSGEQNGKFICASTSCEQIWHPLTLAAGSTPSGTVGSLGTVTRPDGTLQVTYKGLPLYTFAQDTEAGQANGQGIKDVGTWSAVTTGASAAAPAAPSGEGESAKGHGGYGGY